MSKNTDLGNLVNGLFVSSTRNVGIGTTSPTVALDVVGAGKFSSSVTASSGSSAPSFIAIGANNGNGNIQISGSANYQINAGTDTGGMGFVVGGSERVKILNNGNVGIGTTSPTNPLHVETTGADLGIQIYRNVSSDGGSAPLFFSHKNNGGTINTSSIEIVGAGSMIFRTGATGLASFGTERMRITSGGVVMVNRTTTGAQLARVQVSSSATDGYFVEQIAAGGYCHSNIAINNGGTFYFTYFGLTSGFSPGQITSNGSTMTYGGASDYRVKEDFKDLNGLEKVLSIKIYDFKYKNSENRMDGVLAHELQEVLPYAVTGIKDEVNADGTPKIQNVDYSKIVPVLVKAIQELSAEVQLLKNK